MPQPVRTLALPPGEPPSRWRVRRRWLFGTFPGRTLTLGGAIKAFTWPLQSSGTPLPALVEAVDMVGSLALLFAAAYGLTRFAVWAKRRLLWRVRRKLILSYVFVGVIPVLLVISFFLLVGLFLFFNISSYLVKSRFQQLTQQAGFLAGMTVVEVQRSPTPEAMLETLERRQTGAATRYPFLSVSVVPAGSLTCKVEPARAARVPRTLPAALPVTAGPWAHLDAPVSTPKWIGCEGFSGLIAYRVGEGGAAPPGADSVADVHVVIRAVAFPELANPTWAVVLDLPVSNAIEERILQETGIRLGEFGARVTEPTPGRQLEPRPQSQGANEFTISATSQPGVAFLDYVDWTTGAAEGATVAIFISAWDIYDRLSASSASLNQLNLGQALLGILALVGALFLIIQAVALVIGLALARQITGAVHDLFTGTQRLRNRDFSHAIPVRARDQLGELAESFNLMTGEVTALLGEVAEKGRIEQDMLAAREIQQKLLPSGPLSVTGLQVTAFCEPAREVAGDYYDFLPITDTMLGVLIADVSGKGLAAGLYMAQLKVIVQSLSRLHHEPREFLIAVNRVVAANLDARSFITMSYGVIDLERREMTLARAGHCPLLMVPGSEPVGLRKARMIAPDGLVVGLKIDDGQMFESMLQETTVPLASGDLLTFFTDGISETMNEAFDCFGEQRLAQVVEQYAHLPFDQLRSYVMAELRAFSGTADQHDDMTMILLRVQ
jgi:sigma-B regulation protein RsbU (phosphoserine phosphatase)